MLQLTEISACYSCDEKSSQRSSDIQSHPKSGVKVDIQEAKLFAFVHMPGFSGSYFLKTPISYNSQIYGGACNNFKIPSYIPNIIAALGTVLRR